MVKNTKLRGNSFRIALAQFDASVSDIKGNTTKIQRLPCKAFGKNTRMPIINRYTS
jgi:hypothetical protein